MVSDPSDSLPAVPSAWTPAPFQGADLLPVDLPAMPPAGGTDELVGRDNVDASDLVLPSLKLLQGMSPPVVAGVDGAQPGKFWNSATGEMWKGPLRLLLVHHSKSRTLFPKDNQPEYDGLEKCISRDGLFGSVYGDCSQCKYREWREDPKNPRKNLRPLCTESHNFVAFTPTGPAVLRCAGTSFKAGKQLVSTWVMSPKNLWHHPTVVTATPEQKDMNGQKATFFVLGLRWDMRELVPEQVRAQAKKLFEQVQEAHAAGRFASEPDEDENDADPNI